MNTLTYLIRQSHAQFWGVGVVKMTCLSSQWASQWGTRWFNPLSPKCYSGVWTNSHLSGSIWIFPLDQNCWGAMVMWSTYNLNGAFFFFSFFFLLFVFRHPYLVKALCYCDTSDITSKVIFSSLWNRLPFIMVIWRLVMRLTDGLKTKNRS